jgi:hypothetical protein
MKKPLALVRAWLTLDFFGDARRSGAGHASSLTTTIFAQSFLALGFAALLYPDTPRVPFAAANLSLSTLLLALGALGEAGRPERRAADAVLLRTAPLSPMAAATARALHAAFALMLVTIGMALPPAILLAFLVGEPLQAPLYVAAACLCSGLAAGALGLGAKVAQAWLGADRAALAMGTLKAVLYGGGLVLFARSLPALDATADALPIGRAWLDAVPPYHAAKWLAAPAAEAWRLGALLAAGAALALAAGLVRDDGDGAARRRRRGGALLRLLHGVTPPGPARGIAEFAAIGVWRSPSFRARALPLLGIPAAMAFLAIGGDEQDADPRLVAVLLQAPAMYLPFLVMFLPHADHPGASWMFAHAPRLGLATVRDATWRALCTHVVLPIGGAMALAVAAAAPGPGAANCAAALFAVGVAAFAARRAVRALPAPPFSRALEGETGLDFGQLMIGTMALGALGFAFAAWTPTAMKWPLALATLAGAGWALRRRPRAVAGGDDVSVDAPDDDAGAPPADPFAVHAAAATPSLRRELRAVAVLYAITSLLPLAIGAMFAP